MKILLVEDDPLMIKMYKKKFEFEGFHVDVAENGEEGLGMLKRGQKPDVILLDVMMPGLSGFEVLERMKKENGLKPIPTYLLTNLTGSDEERRRAKALGAVDYLVKSDFTPQQLVEKLKEAVHSNQHGGEK